MSDIRETVKENLIRLRREHKLTQMELSQRINYSDKAISRWENGDVTPDVETLAALAALYGVPITVFFLPADAQLSSAERRALKKAKKAQEKEEKRKRREEEERKKEARTPAEKPVKARNPAGTRRLAFLIFMLCFLWTLVLSLFFLLNDTVVNAWRVFLWGAPATILFLLLYFHPSRHSVVRTVFASLLLWTVLVCIYLQIARWTLFPILFAGIPLQAIIILFPFFSKAKREAP